MEIDVNEKVDFSYPEGYQKALDSLTFLPEEARAGLVEAFFGQPLIMI